MTATEIPAVMDDGRARRTTRDAESVGLFSFATFIVRTKKVDDKRKTYEFAFRNVSMKSAKASTPSSGIAL